jgi:hypothetical protein
VLVSNHNYALHWKKYIYQANFRMIKVLANGICLSPSRRQQRILFFWHFAAACFNLVDVSYDSDPISSNYILIMSYIIV